MLLGWILLAQLLMPVKLAQVAEIASPPVTGRISLKFYTLNLVGTAPTNGDNDGYADAGETNDLTLTLVNKTGLDLTNLVVSVATNDATVECITPYQVTVPAVAAGATFTTPAFRIKIADAPVVNRTDVAQTLEAKLAFAAHADQFQALARPMRITLPLDLDLTISGGLGTWFEDFENPSGLGKFTQVTLDAGKNSLTLGNGMRCQYNDPDGPNSNSANNPDCFPGFAADPPAGVNDWHLHDSTSSNGGLGRAYSGVKSLHWGVHLATTPRRDTTRYKQIDAVKSVIINVPGVNTHPELSFAQQVSLVDNRGLTVVNFESVDRAVVEVNILDSAGFDGPLWKKIYPYVNDYDEQGTDQYANCLFDPTDDGNNEDDYFDPSDPQRRFGPSSTCKPEWVFACQGDTDYRHNDLTPQLCHAESGFKSADAIGTWSVPVFNLQEFAGRRIKVRFLASSFDLGVSQTWDEYFSRDDVVADDGWYIDAVKVSPVGNLAPNLVPDTKSITPIPCAACSSINAAITATPTTSDPGAPVSLDASASTVDVCKIGPPQYTFWIDENANGVAGDAGDTLLRAAADDPTLLIAPEDTDRMAVVVSCRTEPLCDTADGSNTAEQLVTVTCPTSADHVAFGQTIVLDESYGSVLLDWPVAKRVDIVKGCLVGGCSSTTLRASGGFGGTLQCLAADTEPITEFYDPYYDDPYQLLPGDGYFYLVRGRVTACGLPPGYTTNAATERPGRDAEIAADPNTCP